MRADFFFFFGIGDTDGWYDRSEEGSLRRVLSRGSGVAIYLLRQTNAAEIFGSKKTPKVLFCDKRCPFWDFRLSSFMQVDSAFQRHPSRCIE